MRQQLILHAYSQSDKLRLKLIVKYNLPIHMQIMSLKPYFCNFNQTSYLTAYFLAKTAFKAPPVCVFSLTTPSGVVAATT